MREYEAADLQRVQQLELMILEDFLALCRRHGLTCFGFAGTGIGAVRHKGFIPWDDDIDVGLLRPDYEAFLRYAKQELGEKYIVMNVQEDPNFPLMTTRLMLRGTKFREEALKDIRCKLGIFLDIYAFDQASDDERQFKKQCRDAWLFSKLLILRSIPFPVLPVRGWKAKVIHAATAVIHGAMVVCRVSKRWIAGRCLEASTRFQNAPQTRRVTYFCDTTPDMNLWEFDKLLPLQTLPFEDLELPFGNGLDESLTRMYGDYMTMPPVEQRKNHYPYQLDFGPYADIPLEQIRARSGGDKIG